VLFDFYTCLYLVIAGFFSGFVIAWISRLFTIKSLHKTIIEREKQINALHQSVDLITNELESCTLTNNALQIQTTEDVQTIETLRSTNEQLQNQISDFSFPTEKIDAIKDKTDLSTATDVLLRIRAKKYQVNFDRIGYASNLNKDNLKLIVGIGKFIEQKLNTLGIYTFGQIAKCTDEDIKIITDAIEFFPGQIEKDNWVAQAKKLVKD